MSDAVVHGVPAAAPDWLEAKRRQVGRVRAALVARSANAKVPAVPRVGPRRHSGLRRGVALALAAAILSVVAIFLILFSREVRSAAPAAGATTMRAGRPAVAWRDIVKPVHIYSLEAPAFTRVTPVYAARRHVAGGGREDLMTFGAFDSGAPALRLRIFRRAGEPPEEVPPFAALVHEAAQAGLAVKRGVLPDRMTTRFGQFERADLTLARAGGTDLACAGFRLVREVPALTITGIACGTPASPITRDRTACLIERLDVAAARDDRELIDFFAASELRRNTSCAGMRLGPDGLHAPWLDDHTGRDHASSADKAAATRKRLRRR